MSASTDIADAVCAAWSTAHTRNQLPLAIDVERLFVQVTKQAVSQFPIFDHSAIVDHAVKVFLMPMDEKPSGQGDDRGLITVIYPIQVGIAARLKTTSNADIDPLLDLSESLRDYCLKRDANHIIECEEQAVEQPQILFNPHFDALKTDKLFLSLFVVEFHGGRTV